MSQNPFLYSGRGRLLRRVVATTGNQVSNAANAESTTLANGDCSEVIAAHDCKKLIFDCVTGAAATGDILIEEVIDETASVAGETFATETLAAERSRKWNSGEPLNGFFRIRNTCGQTLQVYCQKEI